MRKILIMLTLLSVMITSTADSIKMNENSPILYEEKKQESNEISSLTTIEVYKLLYENTKETNDKIVNLVEWVIGISIAFLLAIISAQIFFNWKLNKKEIDNINNSIE